MLFQLRDLVFTILEETIRKCFLANHIFGRCYIGLYSKCLNKTIWERFFRRKPCTHIQAFPYLLYSVIVVCQKEKDKRMPSWHITVNLMRYVSSRLFMSISQFSPKPKLRQRRCSQITLEISSSTREGFLFCVFCASVLLLTWISMSLFTDSWSF